MKQNEEFKWIKKLIVKKINKITLSNDECQGTLTFNSVRIYDVTYMKGVYRAEVDITFEGKLRRYYYGGLVSPNEYYATAVKRNRFVRGKLTNEVSRLFGYFGVINKYNIEIKKVVWNKSSQES